MCCAHLRCDRGALSAEGLSVRVLRVWRVLQLRGCVRPGYGCLVWDGGRELQMSGACTCIVHSCAGWDSRLHVLGILEFPPAGVACALPAQPALIVESPDICSPLVPWWRAALVLLVILAWLQSVALAGEFGLGAWRARALSLIPLGEFDA